MEILINKPELKINSCQDGVWLHFATSNGKHAALNLHLQKEASSIIGQTLTQWAKEYALQDQQGKGE